MTANDELARRDVIKRALVELQELRGKLAAAELAQSEAIAVIGMGCRFPGGAHDVESFWHLLHTGKDAISEVPADRWESDAYFDPDPAAPGKMYTRWGGFLDEPIDQFDAEFFNIKPREANTLDPQQRLLLEVAWEALENAALAADKLHGSQTGVFVGISTNDYAQLAMFADPREIDLYTATGNALNAAAGRLAYFLKCNGPALAVDTACSSSLAAIHLACTSLRNGDCELALAGGVSLILLPQATIATARARMMAKDGRCKTFDARGDGYVRSEGCGLTVLKRLSKAVADGDRILAVIRGSAVNQDGASSALTVPNGTAQRAVLEQALVKSKVLAQQISYVEAHGTGTSLGDPIEVDSLKAVLLPGRSAEQRCALGSVKTNIGHLEAAAGIAGFMKTVLALEHEEIPPHLHLQTINPHIELTNTPMYIPTQAQPWPRGVDRRLAGVSSFGFTGTNVHVVVEEAPQREHVPSEVDRPWHILTVSARTETALRQLVARYARHLRTNDLPLADFAHTANVGRSHFACRLALVVQSTSDACAQLDEFAMRSGQPAPCSDVLTRPRASGAAQLAFVFPGNMQFDSQVRRLFEAQPTFRRAVEACVAATPAALRATLCALLVREALPEDEPGVRNCAAFAIEYATAKMWQSWGIMPGAVIGQNAGEYAAACIAGVMRLDDALTLAARGGEVGTIGQMKAAPAQFAIFNHECGRFAEPVELADPDYWRSDRRQPMTSTDLKVLADLGYATLVFLGKSTTENLRQGEGGVNARRDMTSWQAGDIWHSLLTDLADLYMRGHDVDWTGFDHDYRRQRVALPTYPFQRSRYWVEHVSPVQLATSSDVLRPTAHPLLGKRILSPPVQGGEGRMRGQRGHFAAHWNLRLLPIVNDHRIAGMPWVNIVVYLETALVAAQEIFGEGSRVLTDVAITHGLILPEDGNQPVHVIVDWAEDGAAAFEVHSHRHSDDEIKWTMHAQGKIVDAVALSRPQPRNIAAIQQRCAKTLSHAAFYQRMQEQGVALGPSCRWLDEVFHRSGEALGRLRVSPDAAGAASYQLPLSAVDCCFQLLTATIPDVPAGYMFSSLGSFRRHGPDADEGQTPMWCHAELSERDEGRQLLRGNLTLLTETGTVLAEITDVQLRRVDPESLRQQQPSASHGSAFSVQTEFLTILKNAAPAKARHLLEEYVLQNLARALDVAPETISLDTALADVADSLIAVELKYQVEAELQVQVPVAVFLDGSSIRAFVALLGKQIAASATPAEPFETVDPQVLARLLSEVEGLSDEEVAGLLASSNSIGAGHE